MNTPNPLMPQGSLQPQGTSGKSTVRLAVLTIVALHVVFFSGLLIQGCRPTATVENDAATATNILADLPKLNTNEYYGGFQELPSIAGANTQPAVSEATATPPVVNPSGPSQPLAGSFEAVAGARHSEPSRPAAEEAPAAAATKEYKVARGDVFARIAKSHKVTLQALKNANPNVDPNRIKEGQKLLIPQAESKETAVAHSASGTKQELGFAEPAMRPANGKVHEVKAGENLTKIARQHGTTPKAIRVANGMKNDRIVPGQKLKLPGATAANKPELPSSATGQEQTNLLPSAVR